MREKILERIQLIAKNLIEKSDLNKNLVMQKYNQIQSGKMLRSKLILTIVDKKVDFDAMKLCAIIELIQSASLLHDDVIDESDLRRGRESINSRFGNKNAIMLGDILYSSAFFELCFLDSKIAKSISKSVVDLSIGEMMDVEMSNDFNENIEDYIEMIKKKSASLIAASSYSASVLLDNSEATSNKFYQYGLNLGMAFQIIDDILDITQDKNTLGKPALSDFKSGKTTLPYIYLYEELDAREKKWLQSCFKKELDCKDLEKLKHLLNTKSIQKSKQIALRYGEKALNLAQELASPNLEDIIKNMIDRSF